MATTVESKTAPYGSWKSPITSDLIVGASIGLSEVRIDGGVVYWLEQRPQEQGREVVVRSDGYNSHQEIIPQTLNVRSRVHEYGGGAWTLSSGTAYFSDFSNGRLYRTCESSGAIPITPMPAQPGREWRFADGVVDRERNFWIGVREDHTSDGEPINALVAINLMGPEEPGRILVGGHDFFSSPRLSPDGRRLVWLAWDHPNMPWNGTALFMAVLDENGMPTEPARCIAGGTDESICQPEWTLDGGSIIFVSDRSGWWNLYRYDLKTGATRPLAAKAAEFAQAQWFFGMSTYAFAGPERIVCTYSENGVGHLATIDLVDGAVTSLASPFTDISSLRAENDTIVFCGGAPKIPACIVSLDISSGHYRILRKTTDVFDRDEGRMVGYISEAQPIRYSTTGGQTAFGLFYSPLNQDHAAPAGDRPPLLVKCHGGPTASASGALALATQYWTSRGIAVLDVNYGGSTGFGREYRNRLNLNWGVVDVADCINGAKFLVQMGVVDANRIVITGGSAGGFTALTALVLSDFFKGGASHYGVSDVAALALSTHKFESHYLDWLIGPYPHEEARYRERSPVLHADRLRTPVIFFQGDEDVVVPPAQTEMMVEALRRQGKPVGYLLFAGEQHGFRNGTNIQRSLDAELYFYAGQVFGIGLRF
jgi:dipeptidyl aminopeptidase/acylaminoacyl peptidase